MGILRLPVHGQRGVMVPRDAELPSVRVIHKQGINNVLVHIVSIPS